MYMMTRENYEAWCDALGVEPEPPNPPNLSGPNDVSKVQKQTYHKDWPNTPNPDDRSDR
jgi:hypothetical protein